MASNGAGANRKGKGYELKIAKMFSKYSGKEFKRSPMSGAWSSTWAGGGHDEVAGDIIAPSDEIFPYSLELKNHESFSLINLFTTGGEIPQFINQVMGDAIRTHKIPALILHKNRSKNYFVLPYSTELFKKLDDNLYNYFVTRLVYTSDIDDEVRSYKAIVTTLDDIMVLYSYPEFVSLGLECYSNWLNNDNEKTVDIHKNKAGNKETKKSKFDLDSDLAKELGL
ncbi:hypothetical protein RND61_15285 [Streptomyces sp. TRM76323]|uniref:Uncharacterized protein n=1 Tax=Streptomyces tamarix TaxID=3078565 RepID=A0ABU3QLA9_9ACTN|nr:hypothetical protein [Streptomyces tamarix]MDT9683411.1 hypothetical protein [Streptomyces tamarix]